eukprot:CAMPEP_0197649168 /NCGR_PEP_ID=MMETSP1338-20131121/28189_1 /TAXON_ID=43686 ORGANISM="Pelagodinium beii, Strain RCC1491" /NCGR_SAMPLE_ID=MMETSP1338 /ASSEMBLY_ACC=CAM_ASM_000754 /LENGTH=133 /DNA_ID=CAMNT_0043223287 /DNA_START=81 /DNA_END=483 /DNA_ORIENTATION=+
MAGRPIPSALKKQMQKATVKYTDMSNETRQEVLDIIAGAIDKFSTPTGVNNEGAARLIKDSLDKQYGFQWHCAMGKGFCFDVTAQNGTLITATTKESLQFLCTNAEIALCQGKKCLWPGLSELVEFMVAKLVV